MGLLSRLLGTGAGPRDLLADLAEDYRAEAEHAALLRQHAARARYPQAGAALTELAEVEERHAAWLRERLGALGGAVPPLGPVVSSGASQWQRVVAAHQAAQRKRRRLVEHIGRWDPEQPEAVALLRRIADEDQRQLSVYDALIMRSDPQALD
jgi:hypothetical protein